MIDHTAINSLKDTVISEGFTELKEALNKNSVINDSVIIRRYDKQGAGKIIVYIVPKDLNSTETLYTDIEQNLPAEQLPDGYVLISAMPVTDQGEVDLTLLASFEVINESLLSKWTIFLGNNTVFQKLALLPVKKSYQKKYSHRMDLIDDTLYKDILIREQSGKEEQQDKNTHKQGAVKPAIAHGQTLVIPEESPKTLADLLRKTALNYADNGITYVREDGTETFQTYAQLLDEAEALTAGLLQSGLQPGQMAIFQISDNRDFLVSFWACILIGAVPVPLTVPPIYVLSNAAVQKLLNVWNMLDKPLIISSRNLYTELQSVFKLSASSDAKISVLDELKAEARDYHFDIEPDDLTLLLLTSGSTGLPKAVMHSHSTLLNRSISSIAFNHFNDKDISLNWMPLDHVGGIVMFHLRDLVAGCMQIQVATDWILGEPLRWLDLIEKHKVTISWAPNFAYALVNSKIELLQEKTWELSSMRHFLNGGEAIVAKTARQFLSLLSSHGLAETSMKPAWGMSETSSGITDSHTFSLSSTDDSDQTVEVGKPIPNTSLRIVDNNNQLINEGEKGRLQVKGASIMLGYYKNPTANQDVFTSDGWMDTGDVGVLSNDSLTITARTKDEIIINGINYLAAEIEAVTESINGVEVSYSAACAVRRTDSITDELAVFICHSVNTDTELASILRTVRERVTHDIGIKPSYVIPVETAQIPKTNIGKIQRSKLKQGFESGEFNDELKQADLLSEENIVPDWFYKKEWQTKNATGTTPLLENGVFLVFVDEDGLGDTVVEQLTASGHTCVTVGVGKEFAISAEQQYVVDPGNAGHYHQLIESIDNEGLKIDQVLHFWTCKSLGDQLISTDAFNQAQYRSLYSVIFLVRGLVEVWGEHEPLIQLNIFSIETQLITAVEDCNWEYSTVLGVIKTIPLELPWLNCRHIDLESKIKHENVPHILSELTMAKSEDEVAYRDGTRLVWGLSSVNMINENRVSSAIKKGGIYLISGGLGGIGSLFAKFLMTKYHARLILIGTTSLPERSEWNKCIAEKNKVGERIRSYLELESLGQEFIYQTADVSNLAALEKVVADVESQWNEGLSGVFHLASSRDSAVHWADMDLYRVATQSVNIIEDAFRSRVYGAIAINELLKARPGAINVCFSSIISLFGGASFSAYAASQSFLNCFYHHDRKQNQANTYNIIWSVWDSIGMSEKDPEFMKQFYDNAGYFMVNEQQGFDSLDAVLCRDLRDIVIGLDGRKQNVSRFLSSESKPLHETTAFFTSATRDLSVDNELGDLTVEDDFGVTSKCTYKQIQEIPLHEDGEIDYNALLKKELEDDQNENEIVLPQTKVESQIADIWSDVLSIKLGSIGINNSFFQLGGNSLTATQVISRLRSIFNVSLDMKDLFEYSTINKLAALVEQRENNTKEDDIIEPLDMLDPERLLENIDTLSDSQVAELLEKMRNE